MLEQGCNADNLGRMIYDAVDRAVNSRDFQQLNESVCQTVEKVLNNQATSATVHKTTAVYQTKKLYCSTFGKKLAAVCRVFFGMEFAFFGALGLLGAALSAELSVGDLEAVLTMILTAALGIWMMSSGFRASAMLKRFKIYRSIIGDATHCPLELLADGTGKSVDFVCSDLQRMIDKRYFREGHLNKEKTHFLVTHESFRYYEQCRKELEQRKDEVDYVQKKVSSNEQVQKILEQGNAYLQEVRRCNDAIPGEVVSEKISRIELLAKKIFDRVEAEPQIIPDLKKLMDYYLPMTVKLLNAYADMDAQPVQGETIENSKREIEATLDTLNAAFEKLLDDLFEATALDVSSDISVLNTLLAQEGLTEDELLKRKEQNL